MMISREDRLRRIQSGSNPDDWPAAVARTRRASSEQRALAAIPGKRVSYAPKREIQLSDEAANLIATVLKGLLRS